VASHHWAAVALLLIGCSGGRQDTDTGSEDTADSDDSADTDSDDTDSGDTSDTGDTGDTDTGNPDSGDTGDSGDTSDTGDTGDTGDLDGDGFEVPTDCDDTNKYVHPGAAEVCNAVDDDCNGATTHAAITATFVAADDGEPTVLTATFTAGTPTTPADVALNEAGTLYLCGLFYATVGLGADIDVVGVGGNPGSVGLDGGSQTLRSVVRTTATGIDVRVSRVTIRNGGGTVAPTVGVRAGGGIQCDGGAAGNTMALDFVLVNGSSAPRGGGVYTANCDTTATLTFVHDNDGDYGAGWYSDASDLVFQTVLVEDNIDASVGSGMYVGGGTLDAVGLAVSSNESGGEIGSYGGGLVIADSLAGDPATVDLVDSYVNDNHADRAGGIHVSGTSTLSWTGEPNGPGVSTSLLYANSDYDDETGALFLDGDATFEAVYVDFGADFGDANYRYDVETDDGFAYFAENGETFTCTTVRCGPETSGTIAASPDDDALHTGFAGNVFEATDPVTVNSFAMWVEADGAGCPIRGYLLNGFGTDWAVLWSGTAAGPTDGTPVYVTVGPIGVPLTTELQYAFVFAATAPDCYLHFATAGDDDLAGVGTFEGTLTTPTAPVLDAGEELTDATIGTARQYKMRVDWTDL